MKRRPRKTRTAPRKLPRQSRAHATVDAILQAAAYILAREGWARLTTNRVADRAGVNIGSLYQYFPSKEAIVHELLRRHVAAAHANAVGLMPAPETPLSAMIRLGVEHVFAIVSENPELHRVCMDEIPRSMRKPEPIDPALVAEWKRRATAGMVGVPDPELAMFVWGAVIDGVVRAACAQAPHLLASPELARELAVLLERYLIRSPTGRAGRRRSPASR